MSDSRDAIRPRTPLGRAYGVDPTAVPLYCPVTGQDVELEDHKHERYGDCISPCCDTFGIIEDGRCAGCEEQVVYSAGLVGLAGAKAEFDRKADELQANLDEIGRRWTAQRDALRQATKR